MNICTVDNSQNAGFGTNNLTFKSAVHVERGPTPDRTPEVSSEARHIPPPGVVAPHKRAKRLRNDRIDNRVDHKHTFRRP